MAAHSPIVGGSTAGRLLNCPASLAAIRALPPTADVPSEYAEEGTFAHAVMDELMRMRAADEAATLEMRNLPRMLREHMRGVRYHDRELTQAHIDEMILPALEALAALEEIYLEGGPFRVLGIEQRVTFPGVPGAFGTVDLILQNAYYTILVDWKFGQGIGVKAVYADAQGELVNPQLMYYAAAALRSKQRFFKRRKIVVAIIQPRGAEPLSHVEVSRLEIRYFTDDVHRAVLAAVDRNPPYHKGEHCRFAPCKVNCPLWVGPLLDLSMLQPVAREVPMRRDANAYGEYLARAKALVDTVVQLKTEIDQQMHAYLENGGAIPGWKLKDKPSKRQWVDEPTVYKALTSLGFRADEVYRHELVTFKEADATAKRLGVKIPDELRVAPPPTGTTLATSDDPAPPVERALLVEKFTASLRQLQNQAQK